MSNYVGSFGLTRHYGAGEGRDAKYDASAKPAEGMTNFIEVTVDENGPVPNVGEGYGNGQACIPAGAVVVGGKLLTDEAGEAAGISFELVKKDGTDGVALMAAATPTNNSVTNCEGAVVGTRLSEDRYVKSSGTRTGIKAKLLIEFI